MLQAYQTSDFAYQGAGLVAYQDEAGEPVVVDTGGGGHKKKRKPLRIRYSDFETREKYEEAVRAAAMPIIQPAVAAPAPIPFMEPPEEDDDDLLIKAIVLRMFNA